MSSVMLGIGFVVALFTAAAAGWCVRDNQAEREAVDRCLDCDALKKRGGLVVVNGARTGRVVEVAK